MYHLVFVIRYYNKRNIIKDCSIIILDYATVFWECWLFSGYLADAISFLKLKVILSVDSDGVVLSP